MRTLRTLIIVLLLALVCASTALPMAAEYDNGPVRGDHLNWPAGLADLLNSRERVYAYWFNWFDYFYYSGDTAAFNAFLKRYAQMGAASHVLVLHPGTGSVKRLGPAQFSRYKTPDSDEIGFDWAVTGESWGSSDAAGNKMPSVVRAELWLGGQVKLREVVIPDTVEVRFADGVSEKDISPLLQAPAGRRSMTVPLEFDKLLPVFVSGGTKEEPNQINVQWVRFVSSKHLWSDQSDGLIKETVVQVHGSILSWPKAKWRICVELMDGEGRRLDAKSSVVENSGIVLGDAAISPMEQSYVFGETAYSKAKSFRVSVTKADGAGTAADPT